MVSTEEGQKELGNILSNNKVGKIIKGQNENIDFEDPNIIYVPFEPANLIKDHNHKKKIDGVLYDVEEKDIDKDGYVNILGKNFVQENKNKVNLIINGKEENLCHKYKLNKGINTIKFIFKEEINNYIKRLGCK